MTKQLLKFGDSAENAEKYLFLIPFKDSLLRKRMNKNMNEQN